MSERKPSWETIKIPRDMSLEIEKFLTTEYAKKQGFYNKAGFVKEAIRTALNEFYKQPLVHLNVYEDKIRIIDNQKNRIAEITYKNKKPYCDLCDDDVCLHIDYAWSIADLAVILKKKGLRPPI